MSRLTKLQIVQDILSTIDIDNVSTIGETEESEQVSTIVDSIHDEINGEFIWPHLREKTTLELTTTANELKIPDTIVSVNDVWYNSTELEYITPKEMITMLIGRDTSESNIDATGAYNDRDPQYWTSHDDTNIVLDAFDTQLVSSLSLIDAYRTPNEMTNDLDYPDLPAKYHMLLYWGALADSLKTLKEDTTGFNIYRNRFKRNLVQMQRWARRVNRKTDPGKDVNYGRKNA